MLGADSALLAGAGAVLDAAAAVIGAIGEGGVTFAGAGGCGGVALATLTPASRFAGFAAGFLSAATVAVGGPGFAGGLAATVGFATGEDAGAAGCFAAVAVAGEFFSRFLRAISRAASAREICQSAGVGAGAALTGAGAEVVLAVSWSISTRGALKTALRQS